MASTPITTDLPVLSQSIDIDIESIAPTQGFGAGAYDVANMTITAVVQSPVDQKYRLVLQGDIEAGTSAFVRVISASKAHFKDVRNFTRIYKNEAEIIRPVLAKAGEVLDPAKDEEQQLEEHSQRYKTALIQIPAGQQTLRIHASQLLLPVNGDPRQYSFTMYAPQLSLAPVGNVRLGATVMFPLDFKGTVEQVLVEPMPNQPPVNLVAGNNTPVTVGGQQAYGWAFQADPKITLGYRYA